jgi:hypothetical protein
MRIDRIVVPLAAALVVLAAAPALGTETSVVRTAPARNFAAYLPAPSSDVPWLKLDARTKLPKGDFPLGHNAESVGRFTLLSAPHTQV